MTDEIHLLDPTESARPYAPALRGGASLEPAIERLRTLVEYGGERDLILLAARLLHAVNESHALVDGNKRASIQLCEEFLALNDHRLADDEDAVVALVWDAASDEVSEPETAARLRALVREGRPQRPLATRMPAVMDRLAR